MSAGNTYKVGTSGTWGSNSNGYSTSNHDVNFMSSTNNNFYITGVQLELGNEATSFEHRSTHDELLRCQRYFQIIDSANSSRAPQTSDGTCRYFVVLYVAMRAAATITVVGWGGSGTWEVYATARTSEGYNTTTNQVPPVVHLNSEL